MVIQKVLRTMCCSSQFTSAATQNTLARKLPFLNENRGFLGSISTTAPFIAVVTRFSWLGLALLCISWADFAVSQESRGAPNVDSIGDPLPIHALQRYGTLRFQHPGAVVAIALAPDEKTLVSLGMDEVIAWETATGKELWRGGRNRDEAPLDADSYGVRPIVFSGNSEYVYLVRTANSVVRRETRTGQKSIIDLHSSLPSTLPKSIDISRDAQTFVLGGQFGASVMTSRSQELFAVDNLASEPTIFDIRDRLTYRGAYCLAMFSPDEARIALVMSSAPKQINLHDASSGQHQQSINCQANVVRMDFSPDGQQLAVTERDCTVRVYETTTGKPVWKHDLPPHETAESYTSAVVYSPDGKTLAAGASIGADDSVYVFEAADGTVRHVLRGQRGKPWALAFSADNTTMYSSGSDSIIRRWDTHSGKQLALPAGQRGSEVIAFSPDGMRIAQAGESNRIRFFDRVSQANEVMLDHQVEISQLEFTRDSRWLAYAGRAMDQLCVRIMDAKTYAIVAEWTWPAGKDPHAAIDSLKFSDDGSRLAAASFRQGAVRVWDVSNRKQISLLPHQQVHGLTFVAGQTRLITTGWDKFIRFWDIEQGKLISEQEFAEIVDKNHVGDERTFTVCASPIEPMVLTAHLDGRVRVWKLVGTQLELSHHFNVGGFHHNSIAFSPDGVWIAAGNHVGQISIYDAFSGSLAWDVGRHRQSIYRLAYGKGNRFLVSGGKDHLGYLWTLVPEMPNTQTTNLALLWDELASEDASQAYLAYWQLVHSAEVSIPFIRDQVLPVTTLLDMRSHWSGMTVEQSRSRRDLTRKLLQKDESVELTVRALRALSILSNIDTPAARDVLQRVKETAPDARMRAFAIGALQQTSSH